MPIAWVRGFAVPPSAPPRHHVTANPRTRAPSPCDPFPMRIASFLVALTAATTFAQQLPTGVRLDPAGRSIDLGNMPLSMVVAPDGKRAIVLLSGYKTNGLQVVDLESGR